MMATFYSNFEPWDATHSFPFVVTNTKNLKLYRFAKWAINMLSCTVDGKEIVGQKFTERSDDIDLNPVDAEITGPFIYTAKKSHLVFATKLTEKPDDVEIALQKFMIPDSANKVEFVYQLRHKEGVQAENHKVVFFPM